MRNFRFIAMALVLVLAVAGIAVARSGGAPDSIEPAAASFTADPVSQKTRTCTGEDGEYNITHARLRGESVSLDPRLAGDLEIKVKSVVNTTTGLGFSNGSAKIREPGTRRAKSHSRFTAVITPVGQLEGFLHGHARNTERGRARLLANFTATADSEGAVSGEYGGQGPATPQNTAVLASGHCDRGGNEGERGSGRRGPKGDDRRGGRGPKNND